MNFCQVLRLFCADLTSTRIAEVTRINLNTVNRILQILRAKILKLTEAKSYFETGEIETDESYFEVERVRSKQGREAGDKTKVFGIEEARRQALLSDSEQLLGGRTYSDNKKSCSERFDNLR